MLPWQKTAMIFDPPPPWKYYENQQLRFGVFREGVFQKMLALEGQFLKEISVRFAGESHLRTQKNTKQSSAQRFLNDPFPTTPFFSCWVQNNSPRVFLCNSRGRLITKKLVLQESFCGIGGCRDLRLFHVELRKTLRNSRENNFQKILVCNWLREIVAITPKIILKNLDGGSSALVIGF